MKDLQELNTPEEVYNAIFKAYGMSPPDKLVFRVTPYSVQMSNPTPYVPSFTTETVAADDGTPLYKRNAYNPNTSQRLNDVKPRLVKKFTKLTVALDYDIEVNGKPISIKVGVKEKVVSNGKGVPVVNKRVPLDQRVIMNPDFVIVSTRSQKSRAIGLLLAPQCKQSPLNWQEAMRVDNGIFAELMYGVPAVVRFECLTISEFQGKSKTTGDQVKQSAFMEMLTEIKKDSFLFSRFCQRLGEDCSGEGGLDRAYVSISLQGLNEPKKIQKIVNAAVDPAVTARAVADACVANSVLKDTDTGWVYAFGTNAPIGAGTGMASLVEKLESDTLLRVMLQEASRNRQRYAEAIEEESDEIRRWMLMVENAIQAGYACTDGKLPEGAIICEPNGKTWVNSRGEKIIYGGNGKSAEMWEKTVKAHFRKKASELVRKETPQKEIDAIIMDMLGHKTPRDV